jgi:hypothetical protein
MAYQDMMNDLNLNRHLKLPCITYHNVDNGNNSGGLLDNLYNDDNDNDNGDGRTGNGPLFVDQFYPCRIGTTYETAKINLTFRK